MEAEKRAELVKLRIQMRQAADSLHSQSQEVYEMAKRIEELTKYTRIRYAGLRVRGEARALPSSRQTIYARHLSRWVRR